MAHQATHLGNNDHHANQNGKPQHTHIPRIIQNPPAGEVIGGGKVECGICGEVLMDCDR